MAHRHTWRWAMFAWAGSPMKKNFGKEKDSLCSYGITVVTVPVPVVVVTFASAWLVVCARVASGGATIITDHNNT